MAKPTKVSAVAEIAEYFRGSNAAVLTEYRGLSVAQMKELRRSLGTGVTYAVAYIRAGGGGVGTAASGTGGTSSVAFAGGTVSAVGGVGVNVFATSVGNSQAGPTNSGSGATIFAYGTGSFYGEGGGKAQDGALITAGDAVTPAASITVTVGDGGTAGTSGAAGGTGYVYIEYQGG